MSFDSNYLSIISSSTATTSPITVVHNYSSETENGTSSRLEMKKRSGTSDISPKLYFSYVKSKLNFIEKKKLQDRLHKLQKLVSQSKDLGQQAMYEELSKLIAITVRESEAFSVGVTKYIDLESIEKFKSKVKDKVIKFTRLEEFTRPIPQKQRYKIKSIKEKKIFDELWILYVDYTGEVIKTNKEKIREKDPVVFGKFSYAPDVLYYICDWIDEYCHLTLDEVVEVLKTSEPDFKVSNISDIDASLYSSIISEVKRRHERLKDTTPSNYRELMRVDDGIKWHVRLLNWIKQWLT